MTETLPDRAVRAFEGHDAFERDGRACRNCGVDFDTGSVSLEAHFVVPPVHGGTVGVDNLVTLCRQCHATAHESVTTPSV